MSGVQQFCVDGQMPIYHSTKGDERLHPSECLAVCNYLQRDSNLGLYGQ